MSKAVGSLLERAWSVLRAPVGSELASFPLDISFANIPCRVARDTHRVRHFLVPCIDESPQVDSRPAILNSTVRSLAFGGITTNYFDVSCTDASLHPEFDDVISDILDAIETSHKPATEANRVIARWRRLFRSRLVRGLSHEAKSGLVGELSVLSALLDIDPRFPVEHWRGPLREPHDYEMPTRCIEVKAIGEAADAFVVHGWEQLAPHGGKPLDLALVTVVPDADGTTLAELIAGLRERVHSQGTFDSRLLAAGWDAQASNDDCDRFTLGPVICLHVDDAVPRLVASSLKTGQTPAGLTALRYEVEIASVISRAFGSSLSSVAVGRSS